MLSGEGGRKRGGKRELRQRSAGARLEAAHLDLADTSRQQLAELPGESRLIAHQPFLTHLRDLGRQRAQDWLAQHREAIGRRSTVDLTEAFG